MKVRSFGGVFIPTALHEVHKLRESIGRNLRAKSSGDVADKVPWMTPIVAGIWIALSQEHVENDPVAENIDRKTVLVSEHYFWRHEKKRSELALLRLEVRLNRAVSEISNL